MDPPPPLLVGDQDRVVKIDPMARQVGSEDLSGECLFGLPFGEEMQADGQYGPPAMRFFSQISPSE